MVEPDTAYDALMRERILQSLARNRVPGLHFPGHFLGLERRKFGRDGVSIAMLPAPHIADAGGRVGLPAVVLQVDVTLATAMRPFLSPGVRTATVSMQINFTGVPPIGELVCEAQCLGFSQDAALPQAICRGALVSPAGVVCYCTGTFVQLDTPADVKLAPTAWEVENVAEPPRIEGTPLTMSERKVIKHAERCLTAMEPGERFADRFWGGPVRVAGDRTYSRFALGPHVNNRVGNAQGGLMMAQATVTASEAVPRHRLVESISAWFLSPGVGSHLRLRSEIIQQGRSLAVVRTQVFGAQRRRVLEVVTNHAAPNES